MLEAIRYVDLVIPENNWEQKVNDIQRYEADVLVMGDDWAGSDRFNYLQDYCEVIFLPRTPGVSTTKIKKELHLNEPKVNETSLPEEKYKRVED